MSNRAYPVERYDGAVLDDPKAAKHLEFATRMDVIARKHGERSYVIPDRCEGCALIVASLERQREGRPPVQVESGPTKSAPRACDAGAMAQEK